MDGTRRKGVTTHHMPESGQQRGCSSVPVFSALAVLAHVVPEVEIIHAGITYKASVYHWDLSFSFSAALKGRS